MKLALGTLSALVLLVSLASAGPVLEERVTNGSFDLPWTQGFYISWNGVPVTLDAAHPAYTNPSGDHTVMLASTSTMDSGNVVMAVTDPNGMADYIWEAWVFTGDGTSNKGLVVRGDPGDGFENNYNFIIRPGLFELRFRRMDNTAPTTLASFFASALPGGSIAPNTWHRMKVAAVGPTFRCFFDEVELTTTPIVDATYATGWVGIYHFKFGATGFEALFDDLILNGDAVVPTRRESWAGLKSRYR